MLFECSNNCGVIGVKMNWLFFVQKLSFNVTIGEESFAEKLSFGMLQLSFSSELDCGSYVVSISHDSTFWSETKM